MNYLKLITAAAAIAVAVAGLGSASAETFTDIAHVTASQPVFAQSGNCGSRNPGTNLVGTAIGGVAGGLLGNQVGGGNGRTAATAVGAVVGAMTGNNLAGNSNPSAGDCGSRLVGYNVTYEYRGQRYATQMSQAPGDTIPVRVDQQISVRPLSR